MNRMPIITFGDDTDYETLNGLLYPTNGLGWIVEVTLNDGSDFEAEWLGLDVDDRDVAVVLAISEDEPLGIERKIAVQDIAIITIQ